MASTWGSSFGVAWGVSWNIRSGVTFDGGGIPLTHGQLKRLRRKEEDARRQREAGWEAGLLASKELIEQITRAMEPEKIRSLPVRGIFDDYDDDEEAILMLVMS